MVSSSKKNPNQLITNGNSGTIKVPTEYTDAVVVPQTATFEQIASQIEGLKSKKALESPCAQNMLNIIVPCHRVMKEEGVSNVYAGGDEKKEFLLNLENKKS